LISAAEILPSDEVGGNIMTVRGSGVPTPSPRGRIRTRLMDSEAPEGSYSSVTPSFSRQSITSFMFTGVMASAFIILFGNDPHEIVVHPRFQEPLPEYSVLKHTGNLRQGLEMLARRIFRGHQQEN
jgi:hypothetical protein